MQHDIATNVGALREFFDGGSKPLAIQEIKELSTEERAELATLCRTELEKR